jgi:uncharacterized protein (DUF885 family)
MKRFLLAALGLYLLAFAAPAAADPIDPLIADYEAFVQANDPGEGARARGIPPVSWPRVTPAAVAARAARAAALTAQLSAARTTRETDRAILTRLLREHTEAARLDSARIPFTGDWGFQAEPVFAALDTKLATADAADAWIRRLEDVPRYFAEHRANMQRGVASGWTAHADPLTTVIAQTRAQIADDPRASELYAPFLTLPATLDPVDRARIMRRAPEAAALAIQAYRDMLAFLETDYAPHARRTPGIAGMHGGLGAYVSEVDAHTAGAGYTPEQIHVLGQTEVKRIRADMEAVVRSTGFKGSFADFQAFLRRDPQFYARSDADLLRRATSITARLDAVLPQYFLDLPQLSYVVAPVPSSIAPGYTSARYVHGDLASGKPGTFLVNTYALNERPLYELPALAAHEAVPGHHLQISLAQEVSGAPRFRRDYYATAFGEGWGLYAERLAGEAGIYVTPYERFGALSMEMWRACRLVADTGLHWYGWTRAEAERCFTENTALSPLNIRNEVTRYIGWPGQAVAYKVGEIKLLDLRARARARLGGGFDLKTFHSVVLGDGSLPLDVLDARVEAWLAAAAPGGQSAP